MNSWKMIAELTDQQVLGSAGVSQQAPKRKVRAVLINQDGKYAIIHEKKTGLYMLPGGSIEAGEDERTAIQREIWEETGCICDCMEPLGIVSENRYHADAARLTSFFVAHTQTREAFPHLTSEETALGTEVQWRTLDEVFFLLEHMECRSRSHLFLRARDLAALRAYRFCALPNRI